MADITMPQLGETVTEGTITKWFKQVGDKIDADEVLFEVSTDKVDSEVPSSSTSIAARARTASSPSATWSTRLPSPTSGTRKAYSS